MGENKYKLKTVFKDEKTFLIMHLKKKEMVNESLIKSLDQPNFSELLSAEWSKSGGRNKLTFDTSNLVCLKEYIRAEISQEKYFQLVYQIQQIYEKCSKASMPVSNLICSLEYTYYDPKKSKLYMVYAPVANSKYTSNIVKYLCSLHKKASIIISDSNILRRYKEFLDTKRFIQKKNKDKNSSCSYNDIYNFLHELENHDNEGNDTANRSQSDTSFSDNSEKYYQPARKSSETRSPSEPHKDTGLSINESKAAKISKTVKASSYSRKKNTVQPKTIAYIENSDHVRYQITDFPFSLGRDPGCGLVIDNPNISSTHAVIEEINGRYYIRDNDSTNGTYISDNAISCEQLTDGCVFSLYNVSFTFYFAETEEKLIEKHMSTQHPLTKTFAVSSKKSHSEYSAYIQDISNSQNYYINKYPWSSEKLSGIEITGTEKEPMLRNISCDILTAETEKISKGTQFSLYSGCSFNIGQNKYIFYMKY